MNNFMPLLLILLLSMGNGGLSQQNLSAVMNMMGVDKNLPNILSALSQNGGAQFASSGGNGTDGNNNSGAFSMEKLLPMLLNSFASNMGGNSNRQAPTGDAEIYEKSAEAQTASTPNYLRPIKDVAGDEINYALSHYFSNN